jgi:hypothetical protein
MASHHGQLGLSLAFSSYYVWGQILVSTKGPACKFYYPELVLSSLLKFSSVDTAKALLDPPLMILCRMPSTLRSLSTLVASWQCQRCNCTNDSAKSKRRCVSCRAWRDGIAPSSAVGITNADAHGGGGTSFCFSKNDAPNNASPIKVGSPTIGGERESLPLEASSYDYHHHLCLSIQKHYQ